MEAEGWAGGNNPRMTYLFALLCPPLVPDLIDSGGMGGVR